MKNLFGFLAAMAIMMMPAATMVSCSSDDDNEDVALSKFTIDQTAATLTPGEVLNVTVQFFPEGVKDKTVTWTSSDESMPI